MSDELVPELDSNGDLIPDPDSRGSTVWSEPLTETERQIIENVLHGGDLVQTRRWLAHCLRILTAQTSS